MNVSKQKLKQLDERFENYISNLAFEVSETEFTPDKAAERRAKANAADLDFAKIYYPKIFSVNFNKAQKHIAGLKQGNYTVSASRFFGKSSFTYVGKVIKHIAQGKGGIVNITLKTQTPAEERTASIKRIITGNKLLCYDYGIEMVQDQKGYYIFKADGGVTQLIATSVNQGLRAYMDDEFKRFSLAVGDDLYNRESVKSETDNQRVFDFVTSELWGQMEKDGLCIVLGNSITEEAPIVKLKKMNPDKHFTLPAMNKEETESNWPEKFSAEDLIEIKLSLPLDVWEGDYMDSPLEQGEVFDPGWLRFINLNLITIVASITAVDPAHGESPAACDKGAMTVGVDADRKVYVLDVFLRNEGYPLVFDYLDEVHRTTFAHKAILFENDFNQWSHASPWYQQWMEKTKKVLPIISINSKELKTEHRGSDKESRILNLVHPHQTGQILYSEKLKDSPDFEKYKKKNYIRFGSHKNAKLDGLDALATAYILIWGYIETGAFKSLKQKSYNPDKLKSWFR
nr:hypothetical protein 21 [Balneolaceae bacterium]